MSLLNQIEQISEKTALDLIWQLERMAKTAPFDMAVIKNCLLNMYVQTINNLIHTKIKLSMKIYESSFLTRWYWKRKLKEVDTKIVDISEVIDELKKM